MPTVFFETFGCQMNVADSDMLAHLLAARGYARAQRARDADLIVVNTCSVREHAEKRAKTRLDEYAKAKRSSQTLWAVGCMAQRLGDTLKQEIEGIDRVIGAKSIEHIAHDIDSILADMATSVVESGEQAVSSAPVSVFLPVIRGCDNYCAYCIVPYVRGNEHSIPAQTVCDRATGLVARGAKEITLLGQNVNSYHDGVVEFPDLLRKLHEIEGLERIRFITSHPKDLSNGLIAAIAQLPKVCNHIHLPVQSGSTRILEAMNRKYSREDYLRLIDKIRDRMPEADITTDVMVGFPGETEADHRDTLALFEQVRFTAAFTFLYSPREGTAAARLPHQVPEDVKRERLNELIAMQTEITRGYYNSMVGRIVEVLFARKQERKSRAWTGRDYGAKRVLLSCDNDPAGTILRVKVRESSGMTLIAE